MLTIKDKCPICDSILVVYAEKEQNEHFSLVCKNGCFGFDYEYGDSYVYIFKKEFFTLDNAEPFMPKGVEEEVRYWKENDRYLVKILVN